MKPGWKTTEFWTTLIAQALALLAFLGVLTPNDSQTLGEALAKAVAAVCTLIANGAIVVQYIKSRLSLKLKDHAEAPRPLLPLVLLALVLPAVLTPAAAAAGADVRPTAILPWRARIEQQLHALQQRQAPPAPQPIIIQPPLQTLPVPGEPRQQLPVPGEPRQSLPIPGEPRQGLPLPGQPQQPLPVPGDPRQALPTPGAPPPPVPLMPPAGAGPQSYTIRRALAQPLE